MIAGEWDLYIILLDSFHLLPEQIDAQDPTYIDELLIFLQARHDRDELERKRAEA